MNQQPSEPVQLVSDGAAIDVVAVWETIQGEGPFAGKSAVFIRLAGCNMKCPACDTNYTDGRRLRPIADVVADVVAFCSARSLVVITGGEPLRQPAALATLCDALHSEGCRIQIETNGLLCPFPERHRIWDLASFVCSPKSTTIPELLESNLVAMKYVLRAGEVDETDGLPTEVLGYRHRPARVSNETWRADEIYVQPLDEQDDAKNAANLQACVESCMRFGYRLCLQIQKIIGVP